MRRLPWPSDPVDRFELERMVRLASELNPNWRPPARFAYTIDEDNLLDFQCKSLPTMQNHTSELWASMSPVARQAYYLESMLDATNYLRCCVKGLETKTDMPKAKLRDIETVRLSLMGVIADWDFDGEVVRPQNTLRERSRAIDLGGSQGAENDQ